MIYIIYGNDDYLRRKELLKVKQGLGDADSLLANTTVLDGHQINPNELINACGAIPFLHTFRLVIVEGMLEKFDTSKTSYGSIKGQTKLKEEFKEWLFLVEQVTQFPSTTVLIFTDNIEIKNAGSHQLFKQLAPKGQVIPCLQLQGKTLELWIQDKVANAGGSISSSAISLLIDHIGSDLWIMHNSIDQLVNYTDGNKITDNDVREHTSLSNEARIFDLVDAIISGQYETSQRYLHKLVMQGANSLYILAMILRQLRLIIRVKDSSRNLTRSQIMSNLGITNNFIIDKTLKLAKQFTHNSLSVAYHRLLDTDIALKSGKYDEGLAIELLIQELCKSIKK